MYYQHFGLAAEPFSLTPDPAFLGERVLLPPAADLGATHVEGRG